MTPTTLDQASIKPRSSRTRAVSEWTLTGSCISPNSVSVAARSVLTWALLSFLATSFHLLSGDKFFNDCRLGGPSRLELVNHLKLFPLDML